MQRVAYGLVIMAAAAAVTCHSHLPYIFESPRSLAELQEGIDRPIAVPCPTCAGKEHLENCTNGIKFCYHKVYINDACSSRQDCYRGENEYCSDSKFDSRDIRCSEGFNCHAHRCLKYDATMTLPFNNLRFRNRIREISDLINFSLQQEEEGALDE